MFGNMIAKGYTVKSAQMEMSIFAEGNYETKSAHLLNEKIRLTIIDAGYSILNEGKGAKKIFENLL